MYKRLNIRQFYRPLQPAVSGTNGKVTYSEIQPDERLQDFIYCYWQLQTNEELEDSFCYRVVADGCIDIFFEFENPDESYVMGFSNRFAEFSLGKSFNYVGIRFLPTAFAELFEINVSELTNVSESLGNVIPETAVFISGNMHRQMALIDQKQILDQYFCNHIYQSIIEGDHRIWNALHLILANRGDIQLSKDLDAGVSPRQLRRLFKQKIGGTVKTFSRIVRFQHTLELVQGDKLSGSEFFDAGYYDQSHFIKEFNQLYGKTPSEVLVS
ncbi:transcriptional regulator, AraC family [Fodinibius roseus]|uniref:Transcriptional regulator, AraC family n=1 Tax=Fodinibius roseus TaxID=1194090 RepID=A0A1M4YVH8_9BACT|nr:helix-turn-helix domain-containing protein [Fodinibius roseus]SHF09750.1 transcriptional regulator, AraC family [Fodinibius roseus]